ncbi:glycosyltransferase [Methylotenera sp.]|uniref:glycosyltransferase family 2 protein n=1 Tax=Methylotenera sp. TaxID=2051956 RepID=UPI00273175B6|nr:glycosyltransferase [Methylotenera sp.]MDP2231320.1 glycosyltransferase [Methylotenera sp.]MDP3306812.1 glycosyltransferase [Methylotenera sp.]
MSEVSLSDGITEKGNAPIISVNMPVYNCAVYLTEAIESILNQTFQDFELIICNDGSTDHSLKIAKTYAAKDSRISIITRENLGIVATRNEMLAHSRGKFIAVLDCDDVALPNRFALQVKYLEEHPDVVCVGGDTRLIDGKGRYLTTLLHIRGNEAINESALAGNGAITHSCAMMRSDIMRSVGGYDPERNLVEDLDMWLRLGELGKLENIAEPIVKYRLHAKSASELNGLKQRQAAKRACEAASKRRGIACQYNSGELWRPASDTDSKHKFMLQYGWWAWINKEYKTAAIYSLKALKLKMLNKEGWRLLVCALFKRK